MKPVKIARSCRENNFFTKNKICQIEEITWRNEKMYYAKMLVGVEFRSRSVS